MDPPAYVSFLVALIFICFSSADYEVSQEEDIFETSDQQYYPWSRPKQTPKTRNGPNYSTSSPSNEFFNNVGLQPPARQSRPPFMAKTCSNYDLQLNRYLGARGCLLTPSDYFREDPYHLYLLHHHKRYLPQGLGPQGIFGSTGLPAYKPPGVFTTVEKADI